jgi:ATPase family associated with various cellular activities (AAA)
MQVSGSAFALQGVGSSALREELQKHFNVTQLSDIVTAAREFPRISRVDIQIALDQIFAKRPDSKLVGILSPMMGHHPLSLAQLFAPSPFPIDLGPLQHDEIDIGDPDPVRCLRNGLWLSKDRSLPFALLLGLSMLGGLSVEIAVPKGEQGALFSQDFFRDLEVGVGAGRTYRGRVISLEAQHNFLGHGGPVKVHRLRAVQRDEVILPEKTLRLLDRNIGGFVAARERIKELRFSAKKGLLFYGPPGTGKTHTIHYLASHLPGHTTLLVTAEQVAFIGEYFRLARFLQPAIMVIEDVDLIAREREEMRNPAEEALLNKLLNEMDGLREDADVIVILTTNRPDHLEPALASRPGRIDQAIEFPLPDDEGRRKLVRLYSGALEVSQPIMDLLVRRTEGGSPAFIKELMRRAAQYQIEAGKGGVLIQSAVDAAIEEMLFTGGTLNLKLLGGPGVQPTTGSPVS